MRKKKKAPLGTKINGERRETCSAEVKATTIVTSRDTSVSRRHTKNHGTGTNKGKRTNIDVLKKKLKILQKKIWMNFFLR